MFISAKSIRRLIKTLDPPLVSVWDPKLTGEQWLEQYPCSESQEAAIKEQESLFDPERYLEGSKLDLILDRIEIPDPSDDGLDFLGIDGKRRNRRTIEAPCENGEYLLLPGRGYHAITREFVNMPGWLMGLPHAKMGMLQSNVGFFCSLVPPGYSGTLMFLLHPIDIYTIKKGSPVAAIAFEIFIDDVGLQFDSPPGSSFEEWAAIVEQETDPYRGRRGGRIHGSQGEEWEID